MMRRCLIRLCVVPPNMASSSSSSSSSRPDATNTNGDTEREANGNSWRGTKSTTNAEAPPKFRTGKIEGLGPGMEVTTQTSLVQKDTITNVSRKVLGADYDPDEHALLIDLNERSDTVLYGTGAEFQENVKRVRTIVLTHHKWKLNENWYTFLTYILYLCVAYCVFHAVQQQSVLALLRDSRESYIESAEERLVNMDKDRRLAAERSLELFEELVKDKTLDPTKDAKAFADAVEDLQIQIRRMLLPTSEDYHAIVRQQMKLYHEQRMRELVHPE
eukprot:PhM_4_TR14052/c0_g1_i1/m.7792